MKRKIFISINIPEKDRKRLVRAVEKWQDLPVKWVKEQNFHITLAFLGYVTDEIIADICEKVKKVAEAKDIFDIELGRIEIGPTEKEQKLIWLTGDASEELKLLAEDMEKELEIFRSEKKSFRPHITLGKIRKHKWDELLAKPEISEKFPLIITVESVDIMASDFALDGTEYTIVESCPLK